MIIYSILSFFTMWVSPTENKSLSPISMPALGRHFTLGSLYDRHHEKLLEGPKLWNSDELKRYSQVANYGTFFQIIADTNFKENMNHFGLSASLKMSFLSNMVDIEGSAKYLNDVKTKNRQARVSLGYKSDTFKRSVAPELLLKLTYPMVLKQEPEATDVIVAIQYGAGAIFTFDRALQEGENIREVQGRVHVEVTKLPAFSINGTGWVNMTREEKKEVEKFSCKFHGDFNLKTHPGTYEEAIKVYKNLPDLLGKNYEHSVPIKVWLYPIEKLPVKTRSKVVYSIQESIVATVANIIGDLLASMRVCNDILLSTVARRHERIRAKVATFKLYLERYTIHFKQKVGAILPDVRKGEVAESKLVDLIEEKERSPFNKCDLINWLDYYEEEKETLSKIQCLSNYCRNDGDFSAKLLNNIRFTVGLTLRLGTMEEPYLKTLENYLKNQITIRKQSKTVEKWFSPGKDILSHLKMYSGIMKNFNKRNEEDPDKSLKVQFLVREKILAREEKQDVSIEFYDKAILKDRNYPLITSPGRPKEITKTYNSVIVKWAKPTKGLIKLKSYLLNMFVRTEKSTNKSCTSRFCRISQYWSQDTKVIVTNLKSDMSYFFTVYAVTELGETSSSSLSCAITTKKCNVGTYHVTKHKCRTCEAGTFSIVEGTLICNKCPSGTYNPVRGSPSRKNCIKCPKGSYSTITGGKDLSVCKSCDIGQYNSEQGGNDISSCKKCPKGTFGSAKGLLVCEVCRLNTYNSNEGAKACQKCPLDMHTQSTGAVTLSECIGEDQIKVALRNVDDAKKDLDKDANIMNSVVKISHIELGNIIKHLPDEAKALKEIIVKNINAVIQEIDIVHDCKWGNGQGYWQNQNDHWELIGALTLQECMYRCLQLRRSNPTKHINGVVRKKSTGKCVCIASMMVSPSFRYQHCYF